MTPLVTGPVVQIIPLRHWWRPVATALYPRIPFKFKFPFRVRVTGTGNLKPERPEFFRVNLAPRA
mgnify:CR=1 FL=1